MQLPYQCLEKCGDILIAAKGATLNTFNFSDGSKISSYTCLRYSGEQLLNNTKDSIKDQTSQQNPQSEDIDSASGDAPPAKKRKLSDTQDEKNEAVYGDEESKGSKKTQRKKQSKTLESLTVVALASTKDGTHVTAVTGEDKALRVFKHDQKGILEQLSHRQMPKRPSAIAFTPEQDTIVVADKFGDVYSLPLLIPEPETESAQFSGDAEPTPPPETVSEASKPKFFQPAATPLTIHTQRNLRALADQLRQIQTKTDQPAERKFSHTLILGHVSMLTDLALVERHGRRYIATADRDEHIRISRGIPQAHIIETFCLGHAEFVNRLCFPETSPEIMVSGGGDDELFVWEWLQGRVVQRVGLKEHVQGVLEEDLSIVPTSGENGNAAEESFKIAVSAIKHLKAGPGDNRDTILVTCESVPAIFLFSVSEDQKLVYYETIRLDGNPLDLIVCEETGQFVVSIDCVHIPGSTDRVRVDEESKVLPASMSVFGVQGVGWAKSSVQLDCDSNNHNEEVDATKLSNILYTIENLRKRGGEE